VRRTISTKIFRLTGQFTPLLFQIKTLPVDDLVTVYYSQESKEIIGSLIKGIRSFLQKHPGLQIDIQDGRVRLVHLFRASFWSKQDPQQIESRTYRKLIEVAEQTDAQAELEHV
jgi:hypothetical protein